MKKLKILLLTDRLSLGGAETHIISLYRGLTALGHSVTVASCGGELSTDIRHVNIDLTSRSPLKLIRGYFSLRSLIYRERFDLIHAHARLPALIASFVAKKMNIPLLTTVHAHFKTDSLRRKLSVWGFRSVAVSEDLRVYLTRFYSIPSENITVIENGLDFDRCKLPDALKNTDRPLTVLFLSRLDEDCSLCAELLCALASRLSARYPNIRILIGGGGEKLSAIKRKAHLANTLTGKATVSTLGEIRDVTEFLSHGDLFIGVSRCALEALAASLPVIIAGNEGFFGKLTSQNFSLALTSNFCARREIKPTEDLLFDSVCSLLDSITEAKKDACVLCSKARSLLDISVIAPRYESFYRRSIEEFRRSKKHSPKTLLFGYYGFSNLGDDALLRASIERASREFGNSLGALTNLPKRTKRQFALPCFSRLSPFSVFPKLLSCDRLIFGGGTLFQDGTSRRSLIYYLFILRLALLLKKDVILYANGIGSIKSDLLRSSLFNSLKKCTYIGIRDRQSFALLHSALPASAPLVLEKDLSLALIPSTPSRARYLLHSALGSRFNSFFAVFPHSRASRFDRFELDLAIRRYKNMGLTPLFIPCSPDDLYITHLLYKKFGGGLLISLTFSDLLSILPSAKFVISMRYHPLLASQISSVPSLPIGDDPKIKEFL